MAANQQSTRLWWDRERHKFDLFVSEAVIQEAGAGDPVAAQRRLTILQTMAEIPVTDEARDLARCFIDEGLLPKKSLFDALHIATATVNGMDYLLTWNCRHIANATLRNSLQEYCALVGFLLPVICTPVELIGEVNDDR